MYLADVRPRIIEEKGNRSDALFLGFMNGKPLQRAAVYARLEKTRNKTELKKRASCSNIRDSLIHHLVDAEVEDQALWWFVGLAEIPEGADAKKFSRKILSRHPRNK